MSILLYMIPLALLIGLFWLAGFIWSLKTGQYEDLDGAALVLVVDLRDALRQLDVKALAVLAEQKNDIGAVLGRMRFSGV